MFEIKKGLLPKDIKGNVYHDCMSQEIILKKKEIKYLNAKCVTVSYSAILCVSMFKDMMKLIIMNNLEAFQHINPHENDIRLLKMPNKQTILFIFF